MNVVLSVFPGIDLLGMAFKREGFCVVQGGDVIFGSDIRTEHYPPGRFDGIIGGPPCQAFSRLAHMVRHNGYEPKFGNLIPEFERVVREAQPRWFVMENVPGAPTPAVEGYDVHSYALNNRQCLDEDGRSATQNRVRRISWGWSRANGRPRPPLLIDVTLWESPVFEYAATGGSARPIAINPGGKPKRFRDGKSAMPFNSRSRQAARELCRKQGLDESFLAHVPFRQDALCKAIGNGVPLPMGRAIAKAVREAFGAVATCDGIREPG